MVAKSEPYLIGTERLSVGSLPITSRRIFSAKVTERFLSIPVAYELFDTTEVSMGKVDGRGYLSVITEK